MLNVPDSLHRSREDTVDKINESIITGLVTGQNIVTRLRERATRAEPGQALVEYALILALVAVAAVIAFKFLQPAIVDTFGRVTTTLTTSSTPVPTVPTPGP